jgi:hypothetical protein
VTDDLLMFWRLAEECAALSVTLGVVQWLLLLLLLLGGGGGGVCRIQCIQLQAQPAACACAGRSLQPAAGRELNCLGVWALIMLMGERQPSGTARWCGVN